MQQSLPQILSDAADGLAALAAIREVKPDVVLTDIRMPRMDGIELAPMDGGKADLLSNKTIAAMVNTAIVAAVDVAQGSLEETWDSVRGARHPRLDVLAPLSPALMEYNCHKKAPAMLAAIEEAVKLTAKGDPSMGYLDGILRGTRQENADEEELKPEQVIRSSRRADALKEILKALGRGEITPLNLELYDRMKALYPQDVVLTAARECGHSGKGIEDVLKLLESWKDKGLENSEQVDRYVKDFHNQTELIRELRNIWGMDPSRIGKTDRSLVSKWEKELGFNREMILTAAAYASDAKTPTTYLDRILTEYKKKGITTPEQAEKERKQYRTASGKTVGKPAKAVIAQQYEQRDYTGVQDELIAQQDKDMEEFMRNENGGKPDA